MESSSLASSFLVGETIDLRRPAGGDPPDNGEDALSGTYTMDVSVREDEEEDEEGDNGGLGGGLLVGSTLGMVVGERQEECNNCSSIKWGTSFSSLWSSEIARGIMGLSERLDAGVECRVGEGKNGDNDREVDGVCVCSFINEVTGEG